MSNTSKAVLFCVAIGACVPHSLAEAILDRTDEFPRNSLVLIPPSDIDRLGQTVEDLGSRRGRPTGERCFIVAPVTGAGLTKIELSYKAGVDFQAEVKGIAAQAGASVTNNDTATIALDDLKVREGFGVPIRKSCNFHDGSQTVTVITATVVAGKARLVFSRNMSFNAQGSGGWNGVQVNADAGVGISQSGELQGNDIVITGAATPVEVTFTSTKEDLGATPQPGKVVPFPSGYDGTVRIDSLNTATSDGVPILTIVPNTVLSATAENVPSSLKACLVGQPTPLKPGDGCFIWNTNGASGINIWFETPIIAGSQHVIVHLDGYESHFKPTRAH